MSKDELFMLYKKVQNNDKESIELLISEHRKKYPRSTATHDYINRKKMLHTIYLHLTK